MSCVKDELCCLFKMEKCTNIVSFCIVTAQFISMSHGKKTVDLLMINKYTFYKYGALRNGIFRYCCSSTGKGCKAYAHVTTDGIVVKSVTDHNHDNPNLFKLNDGKYIRITQS